MNAIKSAFAALFSSQSRISYRRLLVLLVASVFFALGMLSEAWWGAVALAYIGGDTLSKIDLSGVLARKGAGAKLLSAVAEPDEPDCEPTP